MDQPSKRRDFWTRLGYVATAAWMIGILALTHGDVGDPLFQFIFIVPLSAWIFAIVGIRLFTAARSRRKGQSERR